MSRKLPSDLSGLILNYLNINKLITLKLDNIFGLIIYK